MNLLPRLAPAIITVMFLPVVGVLAWVLVSSAREARTILEETKKIDFTMTMRGAFDKEIAFADALIQNSLQEDSKTGDLNAGASHTPFYDEMALANSAFGDAVLALVGAVDSGTGELDQVVTSHDEFLRSVEELHDALNDGQQITDDTMEAYRSIVHVREADVNGAINQLRSSQNAAVARSVEDLGRLEVPIRREVPMFAMLALLIALGTLRLAKKRNRLEQVERVNEAKVRFIATVSPELRTSLTSVVGFSQLLNDPDVELSEAERSEMVTSVANQSMEVASIVEDLLVAARSELGVLHVESISLDLKDEAARVLALWSPDGPVPNRVLGQSVAAIGDPVRIRQILRNLISDALRYGGPTIDVEVGTRGAGQPRTALSS